MAINHKRGCTHRSKSQEPLASKAEGSVLQLRTIMPLIYMPEAWVRLTVKWWPAPEIWTPEFWISFLWQAAEDISYPSQACGVCLGAHFGGKWHYLLSVISTSQNIETPYSGLNRSIQAPIHRPFTHAPTNACIMQQNRTPPKQSRFFPAVHLKEKRADADQIYSKANHWHRVYCYLTSFDPPSRF